MQRNEYYNEANHLINKLEVNKKARYLKDNSETLNNYWTIGKLIVEAQGGEARAKYGNSLIKEWSERLTKEYGEGYNTTNLKNFRQFYLIYPKGRPLGDQLTWSHFRYILPIKEENKRNYYINLCITHNLSKRELIKEIKSESYERLINKPEHIEIISEDKKVLDVKSYLKNPILLTLNENERILKKKTYKEQS